LQWDASTAGKSATRLAGQTDDVTEATKAGAMVGEWVVVWGAETVSKRVGVWVDGMAARSDVPQAVDWVVQTAHWAEKKAASMVVS
jgi:hypothetical protein